MNTRVPVRWAAGAMVLLLTSCGVADANPTAEELADSLLTTGDLGSGWQVEYSGPLTDDMRAESGGIDMCPEAASVVAPIIAGTESSGDWQADVQAVLQSLDWQMAVFTLPVEREDAEPVSLVQGIVTGDADLVETIFTALSEGYRLCLSIPPTDSDHNATATELPLPEVGSERFGWVLRMGGEDRWDMRWVILRDGPILMNIWENEILSGDNILSDQEIAAIVKTATDKLP